MDSPFTVLVLSVAVLWISAQAGIYLRRGRRDVEILAREDLVMLLTATLTLLALIIGFTFSMAVAEYDRRKNSEQKEADAIGTEYIRVSLLPVEDTNKIRELLLRYLRQRILFYASRDTRQLRNIETATTGLQADLWSAVQASAVMKPDALMALVISGMDGVFSSQASAQAAWSNRIPLEAWLLMGVIAICGNLLLGYIAQCNRTKAKRFFILPLMVPIAFFLVADLDNPRHGVIWANPQNLVNLSRSM